MGRLRSLYAEIDLRTLATLRIGLGLLLLFDLAKRVSGLGIWYVNSGLLPNHRVLWHPEPHQFSYLFAFWTLSQMRVVAAVIAVIYGCFLVGYRTRSFHVLSWLTLISLHTRATLLSNGGDYVFCILMLWTAFMPLGARWSVDSLRSRPETQSEWGETFASLSVAALRIQLCVIYLFNALNKTGDTWKDGSAVHYLLHQARIVTPLGIWVREHAAPVFLQTLTYGTLVVEYAIPVLILSPWLRVWCARLVVVLGWGLHGSVALLSNLGVFSPVMMLFLLCVLHGEDLEWVASRTRLASAIEAAAHRGRAFLRRIVQTGDPPRSASLQPRYQRARIWFREATIAFLIVCATSQLINENPALLEPLAHEPPELMRATIDYVRLAQGWSMFAPDAPQTDAWIVVDALTVSGRHVDPFNRRASSISDPRLRSIPPRLDQNVYFCDYTLRIPDESDFHEPLRDWILNHGSRVHRSDEKIVKFDAYLLEHRSPPPGQLEPSEATQRVFLRGSRSE